MKFEGLTMNQLAERNAVLVQELEKAREVTNCPQGVDLQDHLKQLVAESLAMQTAIEEIKQVYYESDGVTGYHLNGDIAKWDDVMPDLWAIETPATDSILREAEARGATAAGDYLKLNAQHMSDDERLRMQDAAEICYGTAAKLREGKAE